MGKLNRRKFIGTAIGATGVLTTGALVANGLRNDASRGIAPALEVDPSIKSPTDRVRLGRSNLKISLVGIGTGSLGYAHQSRQTRLGQDAFTRLMRYAFDSGINFFDLADAYGSHSFFNKAMKGIPRQQYVIQTKTDSREPQQARHDIDRYLKELGTDYIDSLIIHCVTASEWTSRYSGVMDVFDEAKRQGKIRACGVTCHSFEALQAAAASDWVEINQVRWNQRAAHMDADVETLGALFKKMRGRGQGVIGMKVVGQGDIVNGSRALSPEECFRFQIESGAVDAFVLGVEETNHIDQMLRGTRAALNEVGYRVVSTV